MSVKPTVGPSTTSTGDDTEQKPWVGPEDMRAFDSSRQLGEPGAFPYTRGPHRGMYGERLWTMRQFAGFGSADDTNQRFTARRGSAPRSTCRR